MRKYQVSLKIMRVDEKLNKNALREEIHVYADANNIFEALYAAFHRVEEYLNKAPGVSVSSYLETFYEDKIESYNGNINR